MDIFREIASSKKGDNIFISPASISSLLKIFYEGASGSTAEKLAKYVEDDSDYTPSRGFATESRLYARESIDFKDDYAKKMMDKIVKVDFFNKSDEVKDNINDWVNKFTNGKINPLFVDPLSNHTKMLGVNVTYFKAKWLYSFPKNNTFTDNFYVSKTDTVPVSMMNVNEVFRYGHEKESFGSFSIIEIPYIGNTNMVVILPDETDGLEQVEKNLTVNNINKWCNNTKENEIDLYLPKFTSNVESYDLIQVFTKLGIGDIFSDGDFSNMTDTSVYIDELIHKTYIDVNEDYTEAASATYSLVVDCGTVAKKFHANHPFTYIIRQTNGKILFVGRFCSPKK
ncbi:SPI-2 [Murmansk poxvirus]|uniref:SPI-2 n=1 Tax=Murmansk poxvirus TaxID=2025359 RepID=A0A223FN22_9POXV|nr:SPI-2 [Murmansk poxvirus]AST09379.1 SPI-2 [Murmansk poxvirus]